MKQFINAAVFFLVGFVAGGSNAAHAADPHDIIGIIAGVAVIHEVLDDRKEHREHHDHEDVYDYTEHRYHSRRTETHREAYRRHFPCSRQYAGYRGCRRIIEGDRTIIIIER